MARPDVWDQSGPIVIQPLKFQSGDQAEFSAFEIDQLNRMSRKLGRFFSSVAENPIQIRKMRFLLDQHLEADVVARRVTRYMIKEYSGNADDHTLQATMQNVLAELIIFSELRDLVKPAEVPSEWYQSLGDEERLDQWIVKQVATAETVKVDVHTYRTWIETIQSIKKTDSEKWPENLGVWPEKLAKILKTFGVASQVIELKARAFETSLMNHDSYAEEVFWVSCKTPMFQDASQIRAKNLIWVQDCQKKSQKLRQASLVEARLKYNRVALKTFLARQIEDDPSLKTKPIVVFNPEAMRWALQKDWIVADANLLTKKFWRGSSAELLKPKSNDYDPDSNLIIQQAPIPIVLIASYP